MSYRPDWWPNSATLLMVVDDLHAFNTGSMDLDPRTASRYRLALEHAVDNWKPSNSTYEMILYLLMRAVLAETYKRIGDKQ